MQGRMLFATVVFLALLATALALVVTRGFSQTQENAARQSVAGLQAQGREALRDLVDREAQLTRLYFKEAANISKTLASYLGAMNQLDASLESSVSSNIVRHPQGHATNPHPARLSDLYVPDFVNVQDPGVQRVIRASAVLDGLAPTLMDRHQQAIAIYFVSKHPFTRYYPKGVLEGNLPPDVDVTREPWFEPAGPRANPERRNIWSPLYEDGAGNGLMITTCTPVYTRDVFEGVVCVDVTLREIVEHLDDLRLTPNGYAFLTDQLGRVIAGTPEAIRDLTGYDTIPLPEDRTQPIGLTIAVPEIRHIVESANREVQTTMIGGKEMFIATAKLDDLEWRLVVAAPVVEVSAQSSTVIGAIEEGTTATLQSTFLAMAGFFVLALGGVTLFSVRFTRPIAALVQGTQTVANGDLSATLPVTSNDELGRLAESFNRMTEQLRLQRESSERARNIAEQANRAKSEFLANMSHELRTPLTAIIGYSDLLQFQLQQNNQINTSDIDNVRQAARHLLSLINDILDLSKIEAGKMDLDQGTFNVQSLVDEVTVTIQPLVEQNGNTLTVRCDEGIGAMYADITKVRQVLLNLLSNACKFTKNGTITLKVHREQIDDEEWVTFKVADTGIGMTKEQVDNLFQKFVQADASTTRKYGGTGLGLALSRRLCMLMGGDISVTSEPGIGSTFTVQLPASVHLIENQDDLSPQNDVLQRAPRAADINSWMGSLVLVIDDDPVVCELLSHHLAQDGYMVETVNGGADALQRARDTLPDLIILDVLMPDVDGWEVLTALKADPVLCHIPVIMLTVVDEKERAVRLGASDYMIKPVDRAKLAQLLRKHQVYHYESSNGAVEMETTSTLS
ncbi:MAG: ATP-binding protein [Chloroflexaceae bacterium]|nr:ATP-binding protein [Chloroflexaceae bacterium]